MQVCLELAQEVCSIAPLVVHEFVYFDLVVFYQNSKMNTRILQVFGGLTSSSAQQG